MATVADVKKEARKLGATVELEGYRDNEGGKEWWAARVHWTPTRRCGIALYSFDFASKGEFCDEIIRKMRKSRQAKKGTK